MRRRKNINKERIVSFVVAGAILATLGVGVYAVTNAGGGEPGNNIVDLNETEAPDLAFKAEDATDGVSGNEAENVADNDVENNVENNADNNTDNEAENEGNVSEGDDQYYDEKEMEEIYDEIGTESATQATASASDNAVVNAPAVVDPAAAYTFSENSSLLWPVKGDIILKYSMDSTILFKTLGVYRCNPAILIKADVGTNVGVAADGVVVDKRESEETGTTVSVAVGSGYVVTYGQLEDVVVKAGDKVTAGQLLGTVAEPTAYYVEEGTHVYFAVTKDDVPVNPAEFLAE